jgi:hypothetical protein
LKANFESGLSHVSFESLITGAFNVGLIGSTCTALPLPPPPPLRRRPALHAVAVTAIILHLSAIPPRHIGMLLAPPLTTAVRKLCSG